MSTDVNYNGLQAAPVAVMNLPSKSGDLQVSNVAINPNKGSTLVAQPTYDAVHDFSVAANPNGQWSYLNTNAGVTAPLTNVVTPTSGIEGWQNQGAVVPNATSVWHNTDSANVNYLTIVTPPNFLGMDPESLSVTSRWTAPSAGVWSISGLFQGIDTSEHAHNVEIVMNGSLVLLGPTNLNAFGQQVPFNFPSLNLNQGATVDFIASNAGDYRNLATGLSVEIAQPSTVTWTDTNDGNIPTTTPWSDHVVVTNTTTGHTLANFDVPYDPNVYGFLAPGASVARQAPLVLPIGADATGNIQVTVTANSYHTAFEQAGSLINADLRTYINGGDLPPRRRLPR